MNCIKQKPNKPSFSQKGLNGYTYPLENRKIGVHFVDVKQGHDKFLISKVLTHVYYILEGNGTFIIDGKEYPVEKGMLIEVPPKIKYVYSGNMKVLLIVEPSWFEGNEDFFEDNPAVK